MASRAVVRELCGFMVWGCCLIIDLRMAREAIGGQAGERVVRMARGAVNSLVRADELEIRFRVLENGWLPAV